MLQQFGFLFLLALSANDGRAGSPFVETLLHPSVTNDGISIDPLGRLYASQNGSGGKTDGDLIHRWTTDGGLESFVSGLPLWPVASDFGPEGRLFVSCFQAGVVCAVSTTGESTVYASGIPGAAGLAVNSWGAVFVVSWSEHSIKRIDPDGRVHVFATGDTIRGPSGLALEAEHQDLYVGNWADGRITRVTEEGKAELFTTLPVPVGTGVASLEVADQTLYASLWGGHRIVAIDLQTREASTLVGTGERGHVDGFSTVAQLANPVGLAASRDGSALYFTQDALAESTAGGAGSLRVVHLKEREEATPELRARAASHLQRRQWEQAIDAYRRVVSLEPEDSIAFAWLATCLRENGDFEAALDACQLAEQGVAGLAAGAWEATRSHAQLGQIDEALAALERAWEAGVCGEPRKIQKLEDFSSLRKEARFKEICRRFVPRYERLLALGEDEDMEGIEKLFRWVATRFDDDESTIIGLLKQAVDELHEEREKRKPNTARLETLEGVLRQGALAADALKESATFSDYVEAAIAWTPEDRAQLLEAWKAYNGTGSATRSHRFAYVIETAERCRAVGERLGDPLLVCWAQHASALVHVAAINYKQLPRGVDMSTHFIRAVGVAQGALTSAQAVHDVDVMVDAINYLASLLPIATDFDLSQLESLIWTAMELRNRLPYGDDGLGDLDRSLERARASDRRNRGIEDSDE